MQLQFGPCAWGYAGTGASSDVCLLLRTVSQANTAREDARLRTATAATPGHADREDRDDEVAAVIMVRPVFLPRRSTARRRK